MNLGNILRGTHPPRCRCNRRDIPVDLRVRRSSGGNRGGGQMGVVISMKNLTMPPPEVLRLPGRFDEPKGDRVMDIRRRTVLSAVWACLRAGIADLHRRVGAGFSSFLEATARSRPSSSGCGTLSLFDITGRSCHRGPGKVESGPRGTGRSQRRQCRRSSFVKFQNGPFRTRV